MPELEIYIGSPIQHGSDRAVFESVVRVLSTRNWPAIIFANVILSGRQIDLIVALERFVLVIEAKGSSVPVRGGPNGPWEVRVASGGWKKISNHYVQALNASYAVRDAMRQLAGVEVSYPSAAL